MDSKDVKSNSTPFEKALSATDTGLYSVGLTCTCAVILMGIGVDLFGFSLVVAAACDLNLTLQEKGILSSLPFMGILLVSYFWGYISDTSGRRFTLQLAMRVSFVLSCLCSLAPNSVVLAITKFFSVVFSCAANSASYTLVGESVAQRYRSRYLLLMTSLLLFTPGAAAFMAYPTLKLSIASEIPFLGIKFTPWRLLCIILALPSGIGAVLIYFFYESPKFLANMGKNEESLYILRRIYAINHRSTQEEFKVTSIKLEEETSDKRNMSLCRSMFEQSAPLFRPPLLRRTLQLFYIVFVVYITNNSFLMWLAHIMNLVRAALEKDMTGNLCTLITSEPSLMENFSLSLDDSLPKCTGDVEDNTIWTLCASSSVFAFLNFLISHLNNKRRVVLISTLLISALGGFFTNVMPEPISSTFFFVLLTGTCVGMGILASYFVDFYPTSYRGMIACLSIMVGRSSSFIGINILGNTLFTYCHITLYLWSILVLSAAVAAWFLPPDKPPEQESAKV